MTGFGFGFGGAVFSSTLKSQTAGWSGATEGLLKTRSPLYRPGEALQRPTTGEIKKEKDFVGGKIPTAAFLS